MLAHERRFGWFIRKHMICLLILYVCKQISNHHLDSLNHSSFIMSQVQYNETIYMIYAYHWVYMPLNCISSTITTFDDEISINNMQNLHIA